MKRFLILILLGCSTFSHAEGGFTPIAAANRDKFVISCKTKLTAALTFVVETQVHYKVEGRTKKIVNSRVKITCDQIISDIDKRTYAGWETMKKPAFLGCFYGITAGVEEAFGREIKLSLFKSCDDLK